MTDGGRRSDESPPDLTRLTGRMEGPLGVIAVATGGLFLLATFYPLYLGREFFLPIAIAVLLNFLLTPAVRGLKRVGIPAAAGAAVMLVAFFGAVGYGTYKAWPPAMQWLERAPHSLAGVLNYVPYPGGVIGFLMVGFVALT